jgi:hypothetical protein
MLVLKRRKRVGDIDFSRIVSASFTFQWKIIGWHEHQQRWWSFIAFNVMAA